MSSSYGNEVIDHHIDPVPAMVDILWISGTQAQVLLPDGTEETWSLGHLVDRLQGVERLQLVVVGGDLDIVPVQPALVPA